MYLGCNESLKKNKVESHQWSCRQCWGVSCVDCSVTFEGEAYKTHTSCISEAEKYQGALYQANSNVKKNPQERWLQQINEARSDDPRVQKGALCTSTSERILMAILLTTFCLDSPSAVLDTLGDYDNIPRKKKKFINFLKNSYNLRNPELEEKVWDALEA